MIENPGVKTKQAHEVKRTSQDLVAIKLGISTRACPKVETGETQLTISRLNKMCTVSEVGPMKVLGFDDKKVFSINNSSTGIHNGEYHLSRIPGRLLLQYEEII